MMKAMKKACNKPSSLEEAEDVCWTHLSLLLFYKEIASYKTKKCSARVQSAECAGMCLGIFF